MKVTALVLTSAWAGTLGNASRLFYGKRKLLIMLSDLKTAEMFYQQDFFSAQAGESISQHDRMTLSASRFPRSID
jgi:hypothetical protein